MSESRHDYTADTAAKDSPRAASTLSSDVVDLLAAIRDALDVPLPGVEDRDERRFCRLMDDRRSAVYATLKALLDERDPRIIARDAEYIRRRTADTPITYTVWQPAGGEQV
ncbi:hypothetical protein ACIO6U_03830 [Streptomyces sp. NPDC087422]|uniref:hypothetical protein n=1 Tax=Streptomyces sp. NPDC087422 TaxID=3365786 RepID=UPI00381ADC76